jgi:hypothetical protein
MAAAGYRDLHTAALGAQRTPDAPRMTGEVPDALAESAVNEFVRLHESPPTTTTA